MRHEVSVKRRSILLAHSVSAHLISFRVTTNGLSGQQSHDATIAGSSKSLLNVGCDSIQASSSSQSQSISKMPPRLPETVTVEPFSETNLRTLPAAMPVPESRLFSILCLTSFTAI